MKTIRGIAHFHSRFSHDGLLTLSEIAEEAGKRGLSFVLVSEHAEDLTRDTYSEAVQSCLDVSKESDLLVVPGIEVPTREGMHLLCFGRREWVAPGATLRETMGLLDRRSTALVLAHLNRYRDLAEADGVSELDGVEVWNHDYDGIVPRPADLERYRSRFREGPPFAFAGADLHQVKSIDSCPVVSCTVDEATESAILDALRKGKAGFGNGIMRLDSRGNARPVSRSKALFHSLKRSLWEKKCARMGLKGLVRLKEMGGDYFSSDPPTPTLVEAPRGEKIMVLSPHPDDESIGAGGFLLLAAKAGSRIDLVQITDGEAGIEGVNGREAGNERLARQEEVARQIGVEKVVRLHLPDGGVGDSGGLAKSLRDLIAKRRPGHILVPHPLDGHPDHGATARALALALGEAGSVAEITVWGYEVWTPLIPNALVDITRFAESKRNLIRCYETQERLRNYSEGALGLNAFRATSLEAPSVRYAEGFLRISGSEFRKFFKLDMTNKCVADEARP